MTKETGRGLVLAGPLPDDLFICPDCGASIGGATLVCPRCERRYLNGRVACFNDRGAYFRSVPPKPEMLALLSLARTWGYRHALREYLAPRFRYLLSRTPLAVPARAHVLSLLDLSGGERVLDFGAALGVLAVPLARMVREVVALEATHQAVDFLNVVRDQEQLPNLVPVCNGDPLRLPFRGASFDRVIFNAAFEYLPETIDVPDVRQAHQLALKEVHRVLRPGGRLCIATKNRFSYQTFLGAKDHHDLYFTPILPRGLANSIAMRLRRRPYRTIVHSLWEYRRLLQGAGFTGIRFYWPRPDLWRPATFVPLSRGRWPVYAGARETAGYSRFKASALAAAALGGFLPALVPTYVILAERSESA